MASQNPSTSTSENDDMQLQCSRGAEEQSASEIPCKRRKKGGKYQAFDLEEKLKLKKYENLESQTRKILNRTYEKLSKVLSRDDMPLEVLYLKTRLTHLQEKTSLDPIRIGLCGRTGAGKTSLLNAILGKKLFLPVSGSSVCTSCVVEVKTSRADQYEATVHLLSDNEWKEELKNLVEVLSKNGNDGGDDDDDDDDDDEEEEDDNDCNECVNDAAEKLRTLYGEGAEKKDYETLLRTAWKVSIPPRRIISIKKQKEEEFSKELDKYIRVRDKGTDCLWPLIKNVEVTIPRSEILPEGIIFLDIPGTGDFNSKRDEMWKESINKCSVIWIVSDIERVVGEKTQDQLLEESIKAFPGGMCTDIALVVSKSDKIDLDEYRRERKNENGLDAQAQCIQRARQSLSHPSSPSQENAAAAEERNQDVKNKKEKSIMQKLKRKLPPDAEVLNKPKLVYTVSAREFWKESPLRILSQEETEIPELERDYVKMIYLEGEWGNSQSWLKTLVPTLSQPSEDLVFRKIGVEELIKKEIDSLENGLQKCFNEILQPLCKGVEQAKKRYKKTVIEMLTRVDGYRGYHKTLKAVFLKDGIYASKKFARIDFNESLAKPLYDEIYSIFGGIFRTQNTTRSNLWSHLKIFKNEVQRKIHQTGKDNSLPIDSSKIHMFIQEVNAILKELEKQILQNKILIYQSLSKSIQSDLKPHYKGKRFSSAIAKYGV
ncbi:nuclear GTPase SLIP-GC [Sphaerodactylus townsendi]|uniref:nuclear GTPase SLIP-GC n=1 Tax=Sphaerodactylus townsendi TaxID=933632 RepID=UPI002026957A|nr:nuclear GTPase SLIP-GC [Sphaerodactylus townsendi]